MTFRKILFLAILLLIVLPRVYAQRDSISLITIINKSAQVAASNPIEKIHVHFDKPYYAVGDTIWFKAYLTIGATHQLSGLSNIIYVDVLTAKDSLITSLRLLASGGLASGDVTLAPRLFYKGSYHFRAYTNWMRNAGSSYFFYKNIHIGSALDNIAITKIDISKSPSGIAARINYRSIDGLPYAEKRVSWRLENDGEVVSKGKSVTDNDGLITIATGRAVTNPSPNASIVTVIELDNKKMVTNTFPLAAAFAENDIQFFPEGGELISGIRSKVAYKALKPDGLGADVTGSIIDNTGNEVASFASQHAGMGVFALLPQDGKTYKANVFFADGSKKTFDLPRIRSTGINLAINNSDPDNLSIKVAASAEYFQQHRNKGFYIIAQSGGTIFYTGVSTLQSAVYTALVPKNKFPTGVLQITLLSASGEPLSERVVFIQRNDQLSLSLSANLPVFAARQQVKMTFTAKNKNVPAAGNFSVAVIDESKVPFSENAETTIFSSLLLSADLRGYIEDPNYYFNKVDDNVLANLDVLMLTQGYRRFNYWEVVTNKSRPAVYLAETGMQIIGTLRLNTGQPVFKGVVNLQVPDKNLSLNAVTDADGRFQFSNLLISDPSKVVLSARNNAGYANMMIIVDPPSKQAITASPKTPAEVLLADSALNVYIRNSRKQLESATNLSEVVISGKRPETPTHDDYSNLRGVSFPDQVLGTDKLKNCSFSIVDCIMGQVFGLTHENDNFYIKRAYDKGNKNPVLFFVNGLAIDYAYLTSMNTADIESVDVFLKDGVSGINQLYNTNGIISITTKSHSFTPKSKTAESMSLVLQGNTVTIDPKGFYKARTFYSPKYDRQQNATPILDLRSTIYWNPAVATDKSGSARFDFYNADGKGTYKAIIEGIDVDGNIGRFVYRYKVK